MGEEKLLIIFWVNIQLKLHAMQQRLLLLHFYLQNIL